MLKKIFLVPVIALSIISTYSQSTLVSSSYPGLRITNSDAQIRLYGGGSEKWAIGSTGASGSDFFIFDYARGATRFIIDENNGNIGIGKSSSGVKLDVNGSIKSSSSISGYSLNATNTITASIFRDTYAGNFYYVDPSSTSKVNQLYYYNLYSSSDIRLKENVTPLQNSLDNILQLGAIKYNLKSNVEKGIVSNKDEKHFGFSAQELKEVIPELVIEDEDGYLAVNYVGLIPVLTQAINEQQEIINSYEDRLTQLEAKFNSLSQEISSVVDQNNENLRMMNYPNPFESETNLSFTIPKDTRNAHLVFYDHTGTLVKKVKISERGNMEITLDGSDFMAGIYTYSLVADNKVVGTNKMIVR